MFGVADFGAPPPRPVAAPAQARVEPSEAEPLAELPLPPPQFADDLRGLMKAVCWRRGLRPKEVIADIRKKKLSRARWEFCWRAYQIRRADGVTRRHSLPSIGKAFQRMGRPEALDHTSVLHGVRRYQQLVDAGLEPAQ